MYFLLDHNVPDSVATVLRELGHTVELVRNILPTDSADPLVATTAETLGAILVSVDRDFKRIAPHIPKGMRARFKGLSRISIECSESSSGTAAVREVMPFIELGLAAGAGKARQAAVCDHHGEQFQRQFVGATLFRSGTCSKGANP